MTVTKYRKLVGQIWAMAPMCNFEMPGVLCDEKELYFRRHYAWMDKEITSMVSLKRVDHFYVSGSG